MKPPLLAALLFIAPSLALVASAAPAAQTALKLQPIFNGKNLTGWKAPTPNPYFQVKDGILLAENDEALKGAMLWTEKSYGDFALEFDARWNGEIDSGVMFREPQLQLQIGVSRSLKRDLTGSFYIGRAGYPEAGQAKNIEAVLKPAGQWNTFRLEARGATYTVWLNGRQVSQYTDEKFAAAAPLGLQVHGGLKMKIEFRNIRAAELK